MKKNHKYLKIFGLITYTLLVAFLLINIKQVSTVVQSVVGVFMPFIYGFILAYILSFPYNFFYNKCFHKFGTKRAKLSKLKKPLSMLCAYIIIFGLLTFLIAILVPELSKSIANLVNDIPVYAETAKVNIDKFFTSVQSQFGFDLYDASTIDKVINMLTGTDIQAFIQKFVSNAFPTVFNIAEGVTTGLYNWIIGIFVSIYMLASKDKLCRQARAVVVAFFSLKVSKKILEVTDLCNKKCGKFIIGKIIDSLIIGIICYVGLMIFKFDYALLISVIVCVTNVIPFFGPFIGSIPCAFLLLLIDPLQSLWFVVFVIILQQFDANFLEPKILGETVGISGFWILFSVIVGGGLFGLVGMLLGVPVFAVIYTLLDEGVTKRLKDKRDMLKAQEVESNYVIADVSQEIVEEVNAEDNSVIDNTQEVQ